MADQELQYAGSHFDVVYTTDTLAYMQSENIAQEDALQVIAKSLSMLFYSYSGKKHFLHSSKSDLGIVCKCVYTKRKSFTVYIKFVFRLSAKEMNFSYNGQKVHLFYTPDYYDPVPREVQPQRPRGESALFKKYKKRKKYPRVVCEASIKITPPPRKFIPADGFVTVLSYLDELLDNDRDEDMILEDIVVLALSHYMRGDVLQLEIIAAPLAVHYV